ncbi:hypothetical protein Landi51_06371 [Colletotrichum acutatum]
MTTLTISPPPPTPSETPQIASIHISSMSSNPLLPLQFPTPASLADLHDRLANDALHHLHDHDTPRILVARVGSDDMVGDDATGTDNSTTDNEINDNGGRGRVVSFVKWDIVRSRGQGQGRSHAIKTPTASASASGSRRLEPANMLPATAAAAGGEVDDGSKEGPPRNKQQHHPNSKAEEAAAAAEQEQDNEESKDEEGPAPANRGYLTAYATAASTARREAMGSRPFLREYSSVHLSNILFSLLVHSLPFGLFFFSDSFIFVFSPSSFAAPFMIQPPFLAQHLQSQLHHPGISHYVKFSGNVARGGHPPTCIGIPPPPQSQLPVPGFPPTVLAAPVPYFPYPQTSHFLAGAV